MATVYLSDDVMREIAVKATHEMEDTILKLDKQVNEDTRFGDALYRYYVPEEKEKAARYVEKFVHMDKHVSGSFSVSGHKFSILFTLSKKSPVPFSPFEWEYMPDTPLYKELLEILAARQELRKKSDALRTKIYEDVRRLRTYHKFVKTNPNLMEFVPERVRWQAGNVSPRKKKEPPVLTISQETQMAIIKARMMR